MEDTMSKSNETQLTPVAKAAVGLLADAHERLCNVMSALSYGGLQPSDLGPALSSVVEILQDAASKYGIPMAKQLMGPDEFSAHMATEMALAKKEAPATAKARLSVLAKAIEVAREKLKVATDKTEIPVYAAPVTSAPPTYAAPVVAAPVAQLSTDTAVAPAQAVVAATVDSAPNVAGAIEKQLAKMNGVSVLSTDANANEEVEETIAWPSDMSLEASMNGEDPRTSVGKAAVSFGADPDWSAASA
jgi:hypothetical protein